MLKEIKIKNFLSILDTSIKLSRINVFIGKNNSGKSNILKALKFADLIESYKNLNVGVLNDNGIICPNTSSLFFNRNEQREEVINLELTFFTKKNNYKIRYNRCCFELDEGVKCEYNNKYINFTVINSDYYDKISFLSFLCNKDKINLNDIFHNLFPRENISIYRIDELSEINLNILFYLALIVTNEVLNMFAIENFCYNIDPYLCRYIIPEMFNLCKEKDKQIFITTHNPVVLDSLNLFDDDVHLFEVFKTDKGDTKTRRIQVKPSFKDKDYKLSELYTSGFLCSF